MKQKLAQKTNLLRGVVVLMALLGAYGCQSLQTVEQVYESQDPYRGSPYPAALDRWTRKCRLYTGGLDLELIAAATFKSQHFREAYTAEYARVYKLGQAEQANMLQDQTEAAQMYNDFIVSAFIPDKRRNDFNLKGSIWKVYLKRGDDVRTQPIEIHRIKPVDAMLTHFFPYISHWDVVYRIRFPVRVTESGEPFYREGAPPMKLLITGVRGTAELVWNGEN